MDESDGDTLCPEETDVERLAEIKGGFGGVAVKPYTNIMVTVG